MSMRMWENLDSNITSTNSRRIHSFVANSAFITGVNLSIPFVGWNYKMSHFPSLILRRPRRFNLLSFTTLLSIQFNHSPQTEVNSYPESVVENIFPLVSSRFAALRVSTSQHELVGAVCGEAQTQQSDGHREGATVCHWCPHLLVNVLLCNLHQWCRNCCIGPSDDLAGTSGHAAEGKWTVAKHAHDSTSGGGQQ